MNLRSLVAAGLVVSAFIASWGLTALVQRRSLAQMPLDVPNARSSHTIATPRGGGIAIVITTTAIILGLAWQQWVTWATVSSLCGGGGLVALIGFIDDRGHVPPQWRLLGHFVAAAWVLAALGGVPPLNLGPVVIGGGWLGIVLAMLYLVWMLNLTNFMDGIDGIACIETITVCGSMVVLGQIAAPARTLWVIPLALAAAVLGFLVWNWSPAKIFLGDIGSGYLGIVLATLSLEEGWVDQRLFWSWLILLGVFVVDATVTLIQRVAHREKLYEAHRSHAYQHLAVRSEMHPRVTIGVGAINLCWLCPLAFIVTTGRLDPLPALAIAYLPLVAAAIWLRAGIPTSQ